MSQNSIVVANGTGLAVRNAINGALDSLTTNFSGASEPATKYALMWWVDTTNNILKIRNSANSGWINVMDLFTGKMMNADKLDGYEALDIPSIICTAGDTVLLSSTAEKISVLGNLVSASKQFCVKHSGIYRIKVDAKVSANCVSSSVVVKGTETKYTDLTETYTTYSFDVLCDAGHTIEVSSSFYGGTNLTNGYAYLKNLYVCTSGSFETLTDKMIME